VGGAGSYPYTATSTQAFDENENDWHSNIGMKFHNGPWTVESEFSGTVSNFHQIREIIDNQPQQRSGTAEQQRERHGQWSLLGPSPNDPNNLYLQNLFESWQRNMDWKPLGVEDQIRLHVGAADVAGRRASVRGPQGGLGRQSRRRRMRARSTPGSCNDGAVSAVSAFGPGAFQGFLGGNGNPHNFQAFATNFLLDKTSMTRAYYGAPLGGPALDPASSFSDDEFTSAVYGQAHFAFQAGFPVDGQVGIRAVSDSRTLSGTNTATVAAVTNTGATPVSSTA